MLENLKKLREKTGTTQRQLAEAIGVSQQSVNKYENHNIEPDIETLVRIADYFAVSVDTVIGHAEDDGELTESEPAPAKVPPPHTKAARCSRCSA